MQLRYFFNYMLLMWKVDVKLTDPEAFSAVSSDKLWSHSSITCPKHIEFSPLPAFTDPTKDTNSIDGHFHPCDVIRLESARVHFGCFSSHHNPWGVCGCGQKATETKSNKVKKTYKQQQNRERKRKKKKWRRKNVCSEETLRWSTAREAPTSTKHYFWPWKLSP